MASHPVLARYNVQLTPASRGSRGQKRQPLLFAVQPLNIVTLSSVPGPCVFPEKKNRETGSSRGERETVLLERD